MNQTKTINVAIAGVGNCASSLIQGTFFYKIPSEVPGLLNWDVGGYTPADIKIVAAFDIDERKVGKDISEAIFAKPNNTLEFCKDIPKQNVVVHRGPTMDGFAEHMNEYPEDWRFKESTQAPIDVVEVLKKVKPDILINYLPVGSERASKFYADCCLEAGVSFINAMPVFICSTDEYIKKFEEKGLVCAGDDIKAQLGATIVHRTLAELMDRRGVKINRTYQLNTGGNTDFLNMLERKRLSSKRISKTESVQSQLKNRLSPENIHIGPSDFVAWQKDNKVCFLRIEGELFGGAPMNIEVRLSVEDSPNSAGIMIDVIRCVKLAKDRGLKGCLLDVSSYGFKHPKIQMKDNVALKLMEDFIQGKK